MLQEDESDDDGHVKPSKPKRLRGQVLGEKDTKTSRETVTKCALAGAREVRTEDTAGLETSRTALRDPLVRDALCERLTTRNLCTVKLEGLPKGYNYLSLLSLAPDMAACRIPHIAISHRPARTVFLEFSSHESALSNQRRLEGMSYKERTLKATLGKFNSEDPDEYSPLEIRVSNLHKKTGKGELTRHFPNATGIIMKDVNKSGRFKYEVGAAVISFGTPAEAISAFDEKHGCVVRGRRVSVMFERKKSPKSVQGLVVYGLKKCTKESEVRALFPQAEAIEIYPLGGFAKLRYGTVEDCKLDKKNALTAKFRGRQLKVVYLRRHGVGDEADIRPVPQGPSTCRVFVKNLGRTAKEDQVKELFKNAKLVSMPKKRHGCRGFAILDFGTTENAQKALSKRHDWHKIVPVLFPKHCLNLALVNGISSPLEVNERLQSGKLQLRPDTTVMVNAEYIVNEAQVEAAAVQALANRASRKPQGKTSFSSEFLACLHPRHSINEAVTVFGVNQETKHVLFVVISMVGEEIVRLDDICQSLSAEPEEITCLSTIANRQKICAAYDVSDVELEAASSENLGMLQSILTKMSVGMLVR